MRNALMVLSFCLYGWSSPYTSFVPKSVFPLVVTLMLTEPPTSLLIYISFYLYSPCDMCDSHTMEIFF